MIRVPIRRFILSFSATSPYYGPFPYFFPTKRTKLEKNKYPTRNALQPGIVLSQTQASKEPQPSSPNRYHRYLSFYLF